MQLNSTLSVRIWRMTRPPPAPRGHAHGHIRAPRGGARQHQVGDVGAGDEQHERWRESSASSGPCRSCCCRFWIPPPPGTSDHMLLGNFGRATVVGVCRARGQPLPQRHGKLGLQCADVGSRTHPAQWIEPVRVCVMQDGAGPRTYGSVERASRNRAGMSETRSPKKPGGAMPMTVKGRA